MLAIYTRLSREDEKSNSIYNQQREGKAFALDNGFTNYRIYNEGEGVSGGADIKDRPEFAQLIEDIIKDEVKAIWVRDQNRIERNQLTFHYFVDLIQKKNINVYIAGKLIDYRDPETFFRTSLDSLFNTKKRIEQSISTKRALHGNLKEGKARGGILAYGYTTDDNRYVIIDEDEAEIVKLIYDLSLQGNGSNKIAKILNESNIPTRYSKMDGTITFTHKDTKKKTTVDKKNIKWAGATVMGILKNENYKGITYLGKGRERKSYPYPIIIEPSYWDKIKKNLPKNRNNSGKKVEYKYLLKGIIRCGKCGRNYVGRSRMPKEGTNYRKDHAYKCSSTRTGYVTCGNRGINITKIESYLVKALTQTWHIKYLFENIDKDDTLKVLNKQLKDLEKENNSFKKKEDRLYKLLINEALQEDERMIDEYNRAKTKRKNLITQINNLKNRIEVEKANDKKSNLSELISKVRIKNNFTSIREVVVELYENIEVLYINLNDKGKGFYLVRKDYRDYNTSALYIVNKTATKWKWMSTSLKDDSRLKELIDNIKNNSMDYYNDLISSDGQQVIKIEKKDLVEFGD